MKKEGITFIEILISLFIFTVFLIPVTIFIQRYHQSYLLNATVAKVVEGINLTREYAINERCNFSVVFEERSFKILKEDKVLVWKEIKFPDNIKVKEKTKGLEPLIFLPDGTAKEAGHIVIIDEITKKEKKIKINNITGKCIIEE